MYSCGIVRSNGAKIMLCFAAVWSNGRKRQQSTGKAFFSIFIKDLLFIIMTNAVLCARMINFHVMKNRIKIETFNSNIVLFL